jgi:hypothetical protein
LNCRQTRALLAIYREVKLNQTDRHAIEAHLSQCAACRKAQEQYNFTGEGLRILPRIEPLPDARTKLLQTLASEHVRFIQYTSASTTAMPTPAFLAPYLRDLAQNAAHANNLVAFSTADTGPIPIVQGPPKRRPIYQIKHFTIIGIAASFLMMLLVGSLTSLVLLTQNGNSITTPSLIIHQPNDVRPVNYTATSVYPHVASAVASGHDIYYTTYNDDESSWQLEQFDEKANSSTALLPQPSTQELIVLGSSANWLVWLQIDLPNAVSSASQSADSASQDATNPANQANNDPNTTLTRAWSLHADYLGSATPFSDRELTSKTFRPSTVPSWINRPIQGISLFQNTLLAAIIDEQGISHLQSYQLDPVKPITQTELATASKDHFLTSPTANSDGTAIYWAEEYISNASGQPSSDVWTLQTVDASPTNAGRWTAHQTSEKYAFRSDGQSFHPQIVNDTLFLLSVNQANANMLGTISTPDAMPSPTPLATAQTNATVTVGPTATPTAAIDLASLPEGAINLDPKIFPPQIDTTLTGRILSFTTSGVAEALPQFDNTQIVTAVQGGTGFLLWQGTDGSTFGMYDVVAKAPVEVSDNVFPQSVAFLEVSGDTAISVTVPQNGKGQGSQASRPVTFDTFRWPIPRS